MVRRGGRLQPRPRRPPPSLNHRGLGWSLGALVLASAATIAILVAGTLGFQMAYADRIPAGVHVLGVDLGGRTRVEAQRLLQNEAAPLLDQKVTLRAGASEWDRTARELGARMNADSLLEQAYGVGREGDPLRRALEQWGALLFGQWLFGPPLLFDPRQQELVLQSIAAEIDRPAQDARIELVRSGDGVSAIIVPDEPGARLLIGESADRLRETLAREAPAVVDLVVEHQLPSTTVADLQAARAQAERMLAAPIILTLDDRRWTIGRDDIARMLAFERGREGRVTVSVNPHVLSSTLERIAKEVEQPPLNARFEWTGANLRLIRESRDGWGLNVERVKVQLRNALLMDERIIPLSPVVLRPTVQSSDGPKLAIKELIKEGRTAFPGAVPEKSHNIRLAASRLHGTVVPPGATFSFNREVGPTTIDSGYKTGWGITLSGSGVRTIPSVAGGICQVATTLFHPVFHAGHMIEERHPHLYWIQQYGRLPLGMKGLDATVDEDYGVDFQFVNNTPDYLLIQARVEGTVLVFGLYGTKPAWGVKIEGPAMTNVVPASREPVLRPEPSMPQGRTLQVEAAEDGFDVTITRTVTLGQDVRTLRLRSHFNPAQNVILHGTGAAQSSTPGAME